MVAESQEAWACKAGVFHGPFPTWRAAWDALGALPGEDGYVLGPTSAEFCRGWIGSSPTAPPPDPS